MATAVGEARYLVLPPELTLLIEPAVKKPFLRHGDGEGAQGHIHVALGLVVAVEALEGFV